MVQRLRPGCPSPHPPAPRQVLQRASQRKWDKGPLCTVWWQILLCYYRPWQGTNQKAAPGGLWPGHLQHIILSPPVAICDIPFLSAETFWELGNWTHCSDTCGHLEAQIQRPQCLMANGQEVSEAFCDEIRKPRAAFQPCNNQDCPHRGVCSHSSLLATSVSLALKCTVILIE